MTNIKNMEEPQISEGSETILFISAFSVISMFLFSSLLVGVVIFELFTT